MTSTRPYVVAVDVGGTCTDCVVFRAGEPVHIGKALSTPPDFASGVLDSMRSAADGIGLALPDLLRQTVLFLHGCTVVDNTVFTREGARTGLITTAGFEDTLLMTRGAYGRWSGQPEDVVKHPVATDRPRSLVPRGRIRGVRERIDSHGEVVEPLDERDVESAVRELLAQDVEALAVTLLWAFRNPAHELRVREIVRRVAPHMDVSLSSEIAPVPGEYERTSTTVINAYTLRVTRNYLDELAQLLRGSGSAGELLIMQGHGGLVPVAEAAQRPVGMIECGPAAGMIGAGYLGNVLDERNIIAADMGGTTFKVGVIRDGKFGSAREPMVDRFHYAAAKLELVSIGAGGGSIVGVEPLTRRPRIGPQSAGSRPGPVCYGRGGSEPTLTDVAAIIGYMDPDTFLGGTIPLDVAAARRVFAQKVAQPLGMDVETAAVGIYRVAAAQLSDLVRNVTVERGLDPRDFTLHAFGGSCGLFAGAFAQELGIARVVVPFTASVNCAFGMIAADVVHHYTLVRTMPAPLGAAEVNEIFGALCQQATQQLSRESFGAERMALQCSADLRYRRQVHQVNTALRGTFPFTQEQVDALLPEFERLYEERYGKGSAFRAAGIEAASFRLQACGLMHRPDTAAQPCGPANPADALRGRRRMFVEDQAGLQEAPIYDFTRLEPGNVVPGPAVIHSPITTIVVQPRQRASMDGWRNLLLEPA